MTSVFVEPRYRVIAVQLIKNGRIIVKIDKLLSNLICIAFTIIIATAEIHTLSIFTLRARNFASRECNRIECQQNSINYGNEDRQLFSKHDRISTLFRVDSKKLTENKSGKKRQNWRPRHSWKSKKPKKHNRICIKAERGDLALFRCVISYHHEWFEAIHGSRGVRSEEKSLRWRELTQRTTDLNERRLYENYDFERDNWKVW